MRIPQARSEFVRGVARIPDVRLRNRFIENNPILQEGEESVSFIQRPALEKWVDVGTGPIRATFHEGGAFNDDLFVVSGDQLYRVSAEKVVTSVALNLFGGDNPGSRVYFACTGEIGDIRNRMFFADGETLRFYTEDGFAFNTLRSTAIPVNGSRISIGSTHYQFTTGNVDAGAPAGTQAAPWLVAVAPASIAQTFDHLLAAINGTGAFGIDYSTATEPNTLVTAESVSTNFIRIRALQEGFESNAIGVTSTGAELAWDNETLQEGGQPNSFQVAVPGDIGVISLAFINGYVIVIPTQGEGVNGRFYWILPGETTIDPLNFATAERSADPIYRVVVVGDQFWLAGQTTTEAWFITGDPLAPLSRVQGILFDRGTLEGVGLEVKSTLMIVDNDGGVFQIQGGSERRISTPDVEERIRKAIAASAVFDF